MPVPSSIADLSTTPASNSPAGSESVGTAMDDYLRTAFAIIKQQDSKGTDIASSGTITIPNSGWYFVVTGTTTINAVNDSYFGREIALRFNGVLQLTHSSGLILPGSANITTAAGDVAIIVNESTGVWRCVSYAKANGREVIGPSGSITASGYTQSTARILGRTTASTGAVEELTVSEGIQMGSGTVKADVNGLTEDTTPDTSADFALVYDASASAHKKVKLNKIGSSLTSGTAQATTSGTSIDFTSIPSSTKQIVIELSGVSTNGSDNIIIQIGDSGGIENTGYAGAVSRITNSASPTTATSSAGWIVSSNVASSDTISGLLVMTLLDASSNLWVVQGNIARTDAAVMCVIAGHKSLSATLDRVRITTPGGANTFDAGSINIAYQ